MKISELLKDYYNKIETDKSYIREILAFCLFCICTIALSFFHEPWFDEFQAWGISRDSLYNILFVIPHYEGHPPLWHLILKCFTHFNLHPELCLKIPNLAIMFVAIWLLIFKSPFPRLVRITLPFTYFLFYQYSIVCRPYSIFVLAIFLSAIFFKTKETNPFRFVSALMLLCLSSAYGVLFAVGITIAWAMELVDFKNFKKSLIDFFKSKQFKAMALLGVFCLVLSVEIMPSPKNASRPFLYFAPIYLKFLYSFFGILSDATVFNIVSQSNSLYIWKYKIIDFIYLFFAMSFGFYLTFFLVKSFKQINKLNYFILPYSVFCLFCFFIYYWPHHVGNLFVFLIFIFWINFDSIKENLLDKNKKVLILILLLTICVQLSWSFCAYINDCRYNYSQSRELAKYIKKYELYKYKIFSTWTESPIYKDKNGNVYFYEEELDREEQYEEYWQINPEHQGTSVLILPYFNRNIIQNFNVDYPEKLYLPHQYRTPEEQAEIKRKWKEKGLPDILVGDARLESVFDGLEIKYNYFPIKTIYFDFVWKNKAPRGSITVYAHKNIYNDMPSEGKNTPKL